jgi:hypothetical protein
MLAAHDTLPPETRARIDTEFRLIDSLADAILEAAAEAGEDLTARFAEMDGFHESVLWTFLERNSYLAIAERFADAERRPESHWLRRRNLPRLAVEVTADLCARLADEVRAHFRTEGRGYSCVVEAYPRHDAIYFFAYAEDHGQIAMVFDQGQFTRRTQRPAFEVVFVYSSDRQTLDSAYRGSRETVRALNRGFGRAVLGVELTDEPADDRVYNLDRFKRRDFPFAWDPASGIQAVRVTELRITHPALAGRRTSFEAGLRDDPSAVYDHMEFWARGGLQLILLQAHVTRVKIRVQFARDGRRGRNTRTFTLTYPNRCGLRQDGRDAVIRQMLIASGIEPVRPATDTAA